ncbi:MAG: alpha-E domain-containing protein, partial [Litorivicinus sp.]
APGDYVFRSLGGLGREGLMYDAGDPALEEIWAKPNYWLAQERLRGSKIPASNQGVLTDVSALIRVYAVRGRGGWTAMPGGLVRYVEGEVATLQASSRAAIGVKDLWVMGEGHEDASIAVTSSAKPSVVNSDPGAVPSRVADALYWTGRYAERLEFIGRLLREVLQRVLEERQSVGPDNPVPGLPLLLSGVALGSQIVDASKPEAQLGTILTQADHPVGLHRALEGLLANARAVPDYLSPDAWRLLVKLEKSLQAAIGLHDLPVGQQIDRVDQVLMLLAATNGLINDTMSRTLGYRFQDIGRHLERGLQTCALLRDAASPMRRNELGFWEMVLGITDTTMTYKRRYRSGIHPGAVVDMLLLDDSTPRALAYQLRRLAEQIDLLPGSVRRGTLPVQQRLALEARTAIQLADPDALMTPEGQPRAVLHELLAQTERRLLALSETLTLRYFNHAEVPHRLTKVST